jgi:hypothetical protein
MMVAANGRVDARELGVLDDLDAYRRLGVSRERFVELAHTCLNEVGSALADRSWLPAEGATYVDALLDAITSPPQRLLVCRLAAAVITADGRVSHDERLVYEHALAHWRIDQETVAQAILHDREQPVSRY